MLQVLDDGKKVLKSRFFQDSPSALLEVAEVSPTALPSCNSLPSLITLLHPALHAYSCRFTKIAKLENGMLPNGVAFRINLLR